MNITPHTTCLAALLLAQLLVPDAAAQAPPWSARWAASYAGMRGDGASADTAALSVELDRRFDGGFTLGAAWGLAWSALDAEAPSADTAWSRGNLLLSGALDPWQLGPVSLTARVRVGAPLALYSDDDIGQKRLLDYGLLAATASLAWRDPARWQLNVAPLALGAEARWQPRADLWVVGLIEPGALIAVNRRPNQLTLRAGLSAGWRGERFGAALGWSGWWASQPLENADRDQHALWLDLLLRLGDAHHLALTPSLALDAPHGLGAAGPKPAWGVALSGAHSF